MRLAVDAMGGDYAPEIAVLGSIQACREYGYHILLVGDKQIIEKHIPAGCNLKTLPLEIIHTSEVIGMEESPVRACRQKKEASLMLALRLVKEGKAEAMVSAGNSGAVLTGALMELKRIPGVSRPALATTLPTLKGPCVIVDVGANMDCKPRHLLQFALMGKLYVQNIFNVSNPRVAVLSIGEEPGKGNELSVESAILLEAASKKGHFDFVGNVEGSDIAEGEVNVVVCDGFVGNVIIKFAEGLAFAIINIWRQELSKRFFTKLIAKTGMLFLQKPLRDFKKKIDYAEYGGAPLLGVDGLCIIAHGKSNIRAFKNALRLSAELSKAKMTELIAAEINQYGWLKAE